MKKINDWKIVAFILIIISGFSPLAKIASNTIDYTLNPQIITFLNQENLKMEWYALIALSSLLLIVDYYRTEKSWIIWLYRVILFLLIIEVYSLRSEMKKFVDAIHYSSGGFLPAFLDKGWCGG